MERHISSLREVRRGCDGRRVGGRVVCLWGRAGEGMETAVAGAGTIWGGKTGRQRPTVCCLVKEGHDS